jgi:arsenate reductase
MTNKDSTVVLHGIKSCDTVRRARKWLESHDIAFTFRDFRETGPRLNEIDRWLTQVGPDVLLNKRSTTWKSLDDSVKNGLAPGQVAKLLAEYPTLIKRPILENGSALTVGFNEDRFRDVLADTGGA